MKRFAVMILLGLGVLLVSEEAKAATIPGDSIGLKMVDGKPHILHRVEKGETLYALSRRYKVSVSQIQESNELAGNALSLGAVLLIPETRGKQSLSLDDYRKKKAGEQEGATPVTNAKDKQQVPAQTAPRKVEVDTRPKEYEGLRLHYVEKGETQYSISRKYGISMADLQNWNGLGESTPLDIGQELIVEAPPFPSSSKEEADLVKEEPETEPVAETSSGGKDGIHVVQPGETLWAVSKKYNMSLKEIRLLNQLTNTDIQPGQKLKVRTEATVQKTITSKPRVAVVSDEQMKVKEGESSLEKAAKAGNDVRAEAVNSTEEPDEEVEPFREEETLADADRTNAGLKDYKVVVPPGAKAEKKRVKGFGEPFWQVEESGKAGPLNSARNKEDKRFYATHKMLPPGTILRVYHPKTKQKVTVEIFDRSPGDDEFVLRLSKKARLYLMMDEGDEVELSYSLPAED